MALLNRKTTILCSVLASAVLFGIACGDDTTDPPANVNVPDGGDDASTGNGNGGDGGTSGNGGSSGTGGEGGTGGDAGEGGTAGIPNDMDASDGSVAGQVQFTVPANGGDVELPFGDEIITFTFPASAADLVITLSLADAADIAGFEDEEFSTVIQMEPDGHVFADPVIVTSSSGDLVALTFSQSSTTNAPEQLELASDGSGFELHHFSYLTFGSLLTLCESTGISETLNAQLCANEGAASTLRTFSCDKYRFCSHTEGYCCVEPGDASGSACITSSTGLLYTFSHLLDVTGDYPYCGAVPVGDGGLPDASIDLDAAVPDGGAFGDASAPDAGDAGFLTCAEAIANLAGPGPTYSALACPNAGGFPATCVAALDWQLNVSCDSFCASMGLSCIYNGAASGTSTGANCSDPFAQPSPTVTQWCGELSDTDKWCHCD